MISHIRNIALLVCLLVLVGIGAYMYFTRPVELSPLRQSSQAYQDTQTVSQAIGSEQSLPTADTASGSVLRFAIDPHESEGAFTISEVLRGSPFTVIGRTNAIAGIVTVDFSDPSHSSTSPIIIDARTFKTDDSRRDGAIARLILRAENQGNEEIVFIPTEITGLPKAFAAGIPFTSTIIGDLTIAGVTKPVAFTATHVLVNPDMITGEANARIKRSDFNLRIPTLPFVADVPDEFTLQLRFKAIASQ